MIVLLLLLLSLSLSLSTIRLVGSRMLTLTHACKNQLKAAKRRRMTVEPSYEQLSAQKAYKKLLRPWTTSTYFCSCHDMKDLVRGRQAERLHNRDCDSDNIF
jgi:hypothetical protein